MAFVSLLGRHHSTTTSKESKLSLYARSDLMSVSIPVTNGGCGATHTRTVTRGAPAPEWKLSCPDCEAYLRGARKQKILKTTQGDAKLGIASRQEHVADSDPHWSSTPETVPLTPDEVRVESVRRERGQQQLLQTQALAAISAAGLSIPKDAMWLLEKSLPGAVVHGSVECRNGHDNKSGAKFCAECGISMDAQKEIEAIPLDMLTIATLKAKCKDAGLSVKGNKEDLISRLREAA